MSLGLKERIEAIIYELQKASADRWDFETSESWSRKTTLKSKKGKNISRHFIAKDRHVSKSRTKSSKSQIKYDKSVGKFLVDPSDLKGTSGLRRADLKSIIRGQAKFVDLPSDKATQIFHYADKRVSIAETKISTLIDKIWMYDDDIINECYPYLDELIYYIQDFIILDSAWTKEYKIIHDSYKIKNLELFGNKLLTFQMAYQATKYEEEIPDEVYNLMSFKEKIQSFALLDYNWDDEGAEVVAKTSIKNALNFLRTFSHVEPCFVCATYEGKVGIDYKNGNLRLETQIISAERVKCIIIKDGKTIIYNEIVPQTDFPTVLKLIKL